MSDKDTSAFTDELIIQRKKLQADGFFLLGMLIITNLAWAAHFFLKG